MASGSKNKAKDRRARKREQYYVRQKDVTTLNKLIRLATHVTDYGDERQRDRLKQVVAIDRSRARAKAVQRNNLRAVRAFDAVA